jgi:hypothetical protein
MTAITVSGPSYLAAREMQVDLEFPNGKFGKGRFFLLFEPVSGLYLHTLGWERDAYPTYDFIGHVEAHGRVGIAGDRLFIAFFGDGVGILDSVEKAASIDDAEARSLKWYTDHLAQVEDRSYRGQLTSTNIPISRFAFPKGFFHSEHDSRPGLPVKLLDMAPGEKGAWVLTLESTDDPTDHPRAKILIHRTYGSWGTPGIVSAEPEKQK